MRGRSVRRSLSVIGALNGLERGAVIAERQPFNVEREVPDQRVQPDEADESGREMRGAAIADPAGSHALAHGLHDDVGTMGQRAQQSRRGDGGIDDEGRIDRVRNAWPPLPSMKNTASRGVRTASTPKTNGIAVYLEHPLPVSRSTIAHPADIECRAGFVVAQMKQLEDALRENAC